MQALDPEPIRLALLDRLKAKMPTVRKWWEQDPTVDQIVQSLTDAPVQAILLQESVEGNDTSGLPTIWEITFSLGIVAGKIRENRAPDADLNAAFVALQTAVLRADSESSELQDGDEVYTTLGGTVVRTRIAGKIEFAPGAVTNISGFVASISALVYAGHG